MPPQDLHLSSREDVFFGEDTGVFFGVASIKSSDIAGILWAILWVIPGWVLWVIHWVIRKRLVELRLDFLASPILVDIPPVFGLCFVQSSRQALLILVLWLQKNGHQVFLWVWLRVWPVLEAGCAMYCISTEAFSACRV